MGIFDFIKPKSQPKTEYDIAKANKAGYYSAEKDYWEAVRLMNEGQGKKAFDLYMKCANKNHKRAQYMVGACYEDGIGVEKNYDKAFEWYTRTISDYHNGTFYYCRDNVAGYTWAKYRLGLLHMWGLGTPQSKPKAEEMFCLLSELAEGSRFDSEKEVAFLACKEIYVNYSNGSNGFPQSYTPAHRWALKTLDAYDFAVKYDSKESREFKRKYRKNHHWVLQFVAYNLENGRGVDKDLEKGTEYRRKAAEMYNDGDDAYWTGRNYEQLDKIDDAKKMYRFAAQKNNEEYRKRAIARLAEMTKEETDAIAALNARLEQSYNVKDYSYAIELYLQGKVRMYDPALKRYITVESKINLEKGLHYLLEFVMSDVENQEPLPDEFIIPKLVMGKDELRHNTLEDYVRARFREKAGLDFVYAVLLYGKAGLTTHTESIFRSSQLSGMLDGTTHDLGILKKASRPVYNTLSEPTMALVQLAKRQDPEALVDLARIYKAKGNDTREKFLLKAASLIYKQRIEAGEPEAMYRYAAIQVHARKENIHMLYDRSPYYYMFSALGRGYALAKADLSHERFSKYVDSEIRRLQRQEADEAGAKLGVYIDYNVPSEIKDAINKSAREMEKMMSESSDSRGFYFNKVYTFMLSNQPFNSPELHKLIDDGVVDSLGDKEMTDMIKNLAYSLKDIEITKEIKDDVMKGIREAFGK